MGNVKKSVAETTRHKRQYARKMKERQMQSIESKVVSSKALDASLFVTECSETKSDDHIISNYSRTYITHVMDANIRPVNNQEPSTEVLSYDESKSRRVSERAFMTLFGQDYETFTRTIEMTENLFPEYTRIKVKQFRETLLLHIGNVKKSVVERTRHKRQYDRRMKERQMQLSESKVVSSKALDASLVVTECSGTKSDEHITSSFSGTYITHVVDADI
nr:hypothetical protein [Tanacetum cinerariifolium]